MWKCWLSVCVCVSYVVCQDIEYFLDGATCFPSLFVLRPRLFDGWLIRKSVATYAASQGHTMKHYKWNTSIYWIMISDTTFSLILWMIGWKTPRLPSLSSHYLLWLKDYFSKNVWMKDSLKWNKQKERFTINFSLCCISNSKSHSDGKINANENAFYQQKKICRTFLINICWNKSRISFISCWKRLPSSLICSEWFVKCLWILSSSPIDIT